MRSQKELEKAARRTRGRLVVLIILVGTVALGVIFHSSQFLTDWWQRLTAPAVIKPDQELANPPISPTSQPTPTPRYLDLKKRLQESLRQKEVTTAIYVYDPAEQESFTINGDEEFAAASLIKLPVIFTLYQKAEQGQIDLTTSYELKEADKIADDWGVVNRQPAGTTYTYRGLVELVLNQSDNVAEAILEKILGAEEIQNKIDFLGMENTDFLQRTTTAADIGLFFKKLLEGRVLNQAHRQEMQDYLTQTAFEEQIPAVLPGNVVVAHKVGIDEEVLHDAGIIFTQPPGVLVVLTQGQERADRQAVIEEVTRTVYQFLSD